MLNNQNISERENAVERKGRLGALYLKKRKKKKLKTKHTLWQVELVQAQRKDRAASTDPANFPHGWHRTPVNPTVTDNIETMVGKLPCLPTANGQRERAAQRATGSRQTVDHQTEMAPCTVQYETASHGPGSKHLVSRCSARYFITTSPCILPDKSSEWVRLSDMQRTDLLRMTWPASGRARI